MRIAIGRSGLPMTANTVQAIGAREWGGKIEDHERAREPLLFFLRRHSAETQPSLHESMSADIGSAKSRQCSPQNNPRRKQTRAPVYVLSFLLALSLVYIFHGQVGRTLPRIQGVEYEDANGDIVYGLRIFAPGTQTEGGAPRDWLIEVGKIPDDSLRDRQLSSYVGLADSWLYFRLTSGEETHFLLASLWLVSRNEVTDVASTRNILLMTLHCTAGESYPPRGSCRNSTQRSKPTRLRCESNNTPSALTGHSHCCILGWDPSHAL